MSGSIPRPITGSQPGMVDPSQRQRLMHYPTSTLSFASFNPRTASSNNDLPDLHKLSLQDELNTAKRVVIETGPNGESFWRFVPKARIDEGVTDEGVWPRCVSLCGELVLFSQDQWDIYKLDPFYECRVRAPPNPSTITISVPTAPPSPNPTKKRQMAPPSPRSDTNPQQPSSLSEALFASSDEEDEVEDMILDDPPLQQHRRTKSAGPSTRTQKVREEILMKKRESRRAKVVRRTNILNNPPFDFNADAPPRPSPPDHKRNLSNVNGCFRTPPDLHYTESVVDTDRRGATYEPAGNTKRNRTMSPSQIKKTLNTTRTSWDHKKKQRQEEEMRNRRLAREQAFLNELYSDLPYSPSNAQPQYRPTGSENPQTVHEESDEELDDDPQYQSHDSDGMDEQERLSREAAIAESRRKLADLEADKPLWEQAARAREARQRAEEETQRALAEERKRAKLRREAEERLAQAREEEAAAAAREEAERQERETAARRNRARRQRQERWYTTNWSTSHALARYREVSETFDESKFTAKDPVTFDSVPWPILKAPMNLSVEDIDWAGVEKFFTAVKPLMLANEYKTFVEKSQRRFHPDRWRSRNVLKSVADESERACLEVAATTVAQALTPLWKKVTGRD